MPCSCDTDEGIKTGSTGVDVMRLEYYDHLQEHTSSLFSSHHEPPLLHHLPSCAIMSDYLQIRVPVPAVAGLHFVGALQAIQGSLGDVDSPGTEVL